MDVRYLRAHSNEVHTLCFIESEKDTAILLSGSLDGTIAAWDALTHVQLLSWRAHTGGVLQLLPLPTNEGQQSSVSHFLSQGRDGCIHCWRLDTPRCAGLVDEVDAVLCDLVGDVPPLLPARTTTAALSDGAPNRALAVQQQSEKELTSSHTAVKLPQKLWSIRAGFGGFCRASVLRTPCPTSSSTVQRQGQNRQQQAATGKATAGRYVPEPEPELDGGTMFLSAPSIDGSGMDVWSFPDTYDYACKPVPVARARVPAAASEYVARALGRMKDVEDGTIAEHSSITDTLKSTGMVMACELVCVPEYRHVMPAQALGRGQEQDVNSGTASQTAVEDVWPVPHPQANSIRELLLSAPRLPAPRSAQPPASNASEGARTGILTVACYENGGVYVLDQGPLAASGAGPVTGSEDSIGAGSGGELPMPTQEAAQLCAAVVSLPVSTVPIMSMALVAATTQPGAFTGCCTTSSPSLYVISLDVLQGTGRVQHVLSMSTPGASFCLPWFSRHGSDNTGGDDELDAAFLVGCWDGSLRVVQRGHEPYGQARSKADGGDTDGRIEHRCHRWQSSSVYAIAYRGDSLVVGCQDGRLSTVPLPQGRGSVV